MKRTPKRRGRANPTKRNRKTRTKTPKARRKNPTKTTNREIKVRTPGEAAAGEAAAASRREAASDRATRRRRRQTRQRPESRLRHHQPPPTTAVAADARRQPKTERQVVIEQLEAAEQVDRRNRLRAAVARPAAAERRRLLRRAGEGSPPQGQDPGKDLRRLRLQHPRRRNRNRAGHRPVRGRTGSRPAAVARSPAWPTTWPSPCACRACASSPRSPARTPSASKCPTNERQLVRLREVMEEANGKAQEDADPALPGQGRGRQPDGRRPDHAAAPADRRPHGHGQERVPELDHRLDAHDPRGPTKSAC